MFLKQKTLIARLVVTKYTTFVFIGKAGFGLIMGRFTYPKNKKPPYTVVNAYFKPEVADLDTDHTQTIVLVHKIPNEISAIMLLTA